MQPDKIQPEGCGQEDSDPQVGSATGLTCHLPPTGIWLAHVTNGDLHLQDRFQGHSNLPIRKGQGSAGLAPGCMILPHENFHNYLHQNNPKLI